MNPIQITNEIQKSLAKQANYLRPVQEHFAKEVNSSTLCLPEFDKAVSEYPFCKKLYIERIPFYTQHKSSLQDLVGKGVIAQETADTFAKFFSAEPNKFNPYTHQVNALEDIRAKKNLVVCTGTGSGKTETFLMPIIDAIIRERKDAAEHEVEYKKGIRALIIYPMNALVNDQVTRIRRLILGAKKKNIPFAKDITYGIYTGDLQGSEPRRLGAELNLPVPEDLYRKANFDNMAHVEIPENEYRSRYQWRKEGGADIIITNHVMLEQLLLDPSKKGMFEGETWKFIVIDEAHTYDGGQGTDISWLIKRVVQRCNMQASDIRFIATTATLVDENEANKEDVIKTEFASKIFPAPADTFSVQFGETMTLESSENVVKRDITWHKAVCRIDIEEYKNQVESLLQRLHGTHNEALSDELRKVFIPSDECLGDLLSFNQWYKDISKWIGSWDFIKKDENVANIIEGKQPLSDVIYLARHLSMLDPDYALPIKEESIFLSIVKDFYKNSLEVERKRKERLENQKPPRKLRYKLDDLLDDIVTLYEENNIQRRRTVKTCVKNILDGKRVDVTAEEIQVIVHFIQEAERKGKGENDPEYLALENLLIDWETVEPIYALSQIMQELKNLHEGVLKQTVTHMWKAALCSLEIECEGHDYEKILTEAVKQDNLFWELNSKLDEPWVCYSDKGWQEICLKPEFEMLTKLLTLTKHDKLFGKPLMDLRFHLLVSGISGAAVYFTKDDNGKVKSNFVFDNDVKFEADSYGRTGLPLFTLGVCHTCGHPYILVYEDKVNDSVNDEYPAYAMRYGDEKKDTLSFKAYTWVKGDHPVEFHNDDDDTDDDREKVTFWLDYNEGIIHRDSECPNENCLELFYMSEAPKQSLRIDKCYACGMERRAAGDEFGYGLIAPYNTGAVKDRTNILTTLARYMDASLYCKGAIAGGRKLLAFSDSRAGAASLALDLDGDIEELLIKQFVEDIISDEKLGPIEELYDAIEKDTLKNELTNAFCGWKADKYFKSDDISRRLEGSIDEYDYYHTLMRILLPLKERLHKSEAYSLLQKEYCDATSNSQMFGELSALSLTALAALRSNRRQGLVRSGRLSVYSHCHTNRKDRNEDRYWKDYKKYFDTDDDAENFFETVYRMLFIDSELDCEPYAGDEGRHYREESDKLVDGYSSGIWSRKIFYTFENKDADNRKLGVRGIYNTKGLPTKFRRILNDEFGIEGAGEQKAILNQLWHYLLSSQIITLVNVSQDKESGKITVEKRNSSGSLEDDVNCFCRLNLYDVRFREGKARSEHEERREEQYYRVEEHTAQLSTAKARIHQNLFSEGKINMLSCSTTFEMGVDLGDLNCVFLSNLPPSVANYRQRAGRAGRRAGSASLAVTYLGKSSHDQSNRYAPEKLMFGQVIRPKIYDDNVSYRSKHFRAEAFSRFLAYCQESEGNEKGIKWRNCQDFFGDEEKKMKGLIDRLEEWVNNQEEKVSLQKYCEKLNGNEPIRIQNKEYNVAEDFVWQILGAGAKGVDVDFYKDITCSLELSGPNIPPSKDSNMNQWNVPVAEKYKEMLEATRRLIEEEEKEDDDEDKNQWKIDFILEKEVTSFFSQNRVLPRYGFPCDVITLLPNSKDRTQYRRGIDLERDARQGLFEYATGKTVVADKRAFVSNAPVSYLRGKNIDGKTRNAKALFVEEISYCKECGTYFSSEYDQCPSCSASGKKSIKPMKACMPDAFIARVSSKARSFSPVTKDKKVIYYPGKTINEDRVKGTLNCVVADSDIKSLWYINDDPKKEKEKKEKSKKSIQYDVFMRDIRTDIVLITYDTSPKYESQELAMTAAMWESALAAVLKAAEDILNVSYRDLGGTISTIDNKKYMVLYDRSSSGSGAVLPLVPSDDEKRNEEVHKKIRNILRRAIEICEGKRNTNESFCKCHEEGEKEKELRSASHLEWLKHQKTGVREARSCYKCLRSYDNQSSHSMLDAYDAKRLLVGLLGEDKGEGVEVGSEMMESEVMMPCVTGVDASPTTTSAEEKETRLSYEDRLDLLEGNVRKGKRYIVRVDDLDPEGVVEMEYQYTMGETIYFLWEGMPCEISIDNIIR